MLAKAPAFTAVAILTLALGIGANTALFSVINSVLLAPLPFPQADRLMALFTRRIAFTTASISYPNFLDWQRNNRTFESLACYRPDDFNLTGAGQAEHILGEMVSADFFSTLGLQPASGRWFTEAEDQRGIVEAEMRVGREHREWADDAERNGLHDRRRDAGVVSSTAAEFPAGCRGVRSR